MIKLIATDIDGTLLKDGTLMLDPEYMTVIEKLIAKGIRFVACSGRQFISERKLFAPIRDKLLYLPQVDCLLDNILLAYSQVNITDITIFLMVIQLM